MAKKRKQISQSEDNLASDPEDEASDAEKIRREDERGRTVLAKVGKAIQSGTKIPVEWHPTRNVPRGDNRTTLSTYIGVVVRERVSINYKKWSDVPKELKDEVCEFIMKGFEVPEKRKAWVLGRASNRWRAFKTRLRKVWLYRSSGKIRQTKPWKYNWITQADWDSFTNYCTSPEFEEQSKKNRERSLKKNTSYRGGRRGYIYFEEEITKELQKQGIHVTQVPRHLVWLRAHSTEKEGAMMFENPADLEIAEAIKVLDAQSQRGEIVANGRDDILAKVINKPEQGGRVRGVGSGVTNKEYFGFNQPTPPNQLRAEMVRMKLEMENMRNNQTIMMSFIMSGGGQLSGPISQFSGGPQLSGPINQGFGAGAQLSGPISQGLGAGAQFGDFSTQRGGFDIQIGGQGIGNGPFNSFTQLLCGNGVEGSIGAQLSAFDEELGGSRGNLSRNSGKNGASGGHEVIKPYHVPWPQQSHPNHVQIPEINCDHLPNTELEPNNHDYTFPKGWSECSLAIENNKGVEIVAIGEVEVADASEVIRVHNVRLTNDLRRVKFLQDLVPSAPLPCPTDEFTYVCQAKHSFATWPVHLIFPKTKVT